MSIPPNVIAYFPERLPVAPRRIFYSVTAPDENKRIVRNFAHSYDNSYHVPLNQGALSDRRTHQGFRAIAQRCNVSTNGVSEAPRNANVLRQNIDTLTQELAMERAAHDATRDSLRDANEESRARQRELNGIGHVLENQPPRIANFEKDKEELRKDKTTWRMQKEYLLKEKNRLLNNLMQAKRQLRRLSNNQDSPHRGPTQRD